MTAMLILGGLALLALGGELVVRGGIGAARALNVSPLVIGVVLMGFGTSLPELVTSVQSALIGSPDIAVGNVVGSNIANLLLIAGLAAALTGAATSRALLWRDGLSMLLTTAAFAVLLLTDNLTPSAGVGLLVALAVYLLWAVASERRRSREQEYEEEEAAVAVKGGLLVALAVFSLGVAATVFGARFLVEGAVDLAASLGAPEALIGVTIVAIGTSLPELAATIAAALRRHTEMAIGNVLGSNIFNVCAIIGVTSLVAPIPVPQEVLTVDVWAMLGATALMLFFARTWLHLSRSEGVTLLIAYGAYLALTISLTI